MTTTNKNSYTIKACLPLAALILNTQLTPMAAAVEAFKGLEEVVVTAQRRSQSTQDIPAAITGITANDIESMGFENANDITAQIPNMNVSNPYGDTQPIFSIRGISMSDYNPNQSSPIGIYADEAYLGAIYTHGLNFFDVERIEALRGPQGTLYGKNTTGGAINIISNTPQINAENSGYINVGIGDYSARSTNGAAETTLIEDKLAARLAFTYKQDDGYVSNKTTGKDVGTTDYMATRLTLNADINQQLNAVFKYTNGKNDSKINPPRNEGIYDIGGDTLVDLSGYGRSSALGFYDTESNREGKLEVNLDQATLRLTYEADTFSVISVSSWYDSDYFMGQDVDGSPLTLLETDWSAKTEAVGQDLRFVSDFAGSINFVAGLYYGKEDVDMQNIYTLYEDDLVVKLNNPDPVEQDYGALLNQFGIADQRMSTTKETLAAYTQIRIEATDKIGVDIGIRYTEDENSLDYLNISRLGYDGTPTGSWTPGNITTNPDADPSNPFANVDSPLVPPGPGFFGPGFYLNGPYSLDSVKPVAVIEREWTGKIGVDYAINDQTMVYASYNRGFRSGSFNSGAYYVERPLSSAYASPEFVDAFELGAKLDFLEGRGRMNAALFSYDYQDQQFINVVGVSNFLENADSDILGAEIELWLQPIDNLTIQSSLGWLDTEYTKLELADTTTSSSIAELQDTVDLKGNSLISAPEINFNIAADYDYDINDNTLLRTHVDAVYLDEQWFSAYNNELNYGGIKQDAYWIYNARVSLLLDDERYMIAAWVKNLTDEEYDTYGINLQSSFGYDYLFPGAPRRYGVEFSYRF